MTGPSMIRKASPWSAFARSAMRSKTASYASSPQKAGRARETRRANDMVKKRKLSSARAAQLMKILQARFEKNLARHPGLDWAKVRSRLEANPDKLWSLGELESTGGEPDVVAHDPKSGECLFCDCSAESPKGRR